jgi:hypothetical protein
LAFILFINLKIKNKVNSDELLIINALLLLFFLMPWAIIISGIKKIEYSKSSLFVSNYITSKEYSMNSVIKLNRWLIFFYKIQLTVESKVVTVKFIPKTNNNIITNLTKNEAVNTFKKLSGKL